MVLATAMAAVSGTVILLAFRLQKSPQDTLFSVDRIPRPSQQVLRSCISSGIYAIPKVHQSHRRNILIIYVDNIFI